MCFTPARNVFVSIQLNTQLRRYLDLIVRWRTHSVNRRIFAAMITVGGFTVLVKLVATAREMVVAYQFGPGSSLDAFLIAWLIPSLAVNVVAGSFNSAFIPTFINVREQEGLAAAQRLLSSATVCGVALLILVTGLLALVAPYLLPLVGSGFDEQKLLLCHSLFLLVLPTIVISGLSTIWSAVLNAGERFALAAIAPIALPAATVIAVLLLSRRWDIYALVIGMVSGYIVQACILAGALRRQGFSLLPRWHGIDVPMKEVIAQYLPMIAGAFLISSTDLVDQSMAAMLGSGSVSALVYGNRVVTFFLGIGSMAIGTAVLPHFSRLAAASDWKSLRHTLYTYGRLIVLITVPLALLGAYFSEPLVKVLFERGAFGSGDTQTVAQIQAFFLLQMPFYLLGILLVRLVSSLKANHILMWGAVISMLLNIVLNYLLMQWFGVSGIALSTTIVYLCSVLYLLYMLSRLKKGNFRERG
jgi:putative peptidoglycan lipid II flippase